MQEYLIVARSGRSLAESAKRAGYCVHVFDEFADEDTREVSASVKQLYFSGKDFSKEQLKKTIQEFLSEHPACEIVLGSGFEQQPELIDHIAKLTTIYSNSVETIQLLKEPKSFFSLLDNYGIHHPPVFFDDPGTLENMLVKKTAGEGGEHIQWCSNKSKKKIQGDYFQRYIEGVAFSAVFLADGESSIIIGNNRQSQSTMHDSMPFLYAGCCRVPYVTERHQFEVSRIIECLVRHTGLKGLCGLDYILDENGDIYVLEVNPRPPASFELHDNAVNLFDAHIACFNGTLEKIVPERCYGFRGYAILYAVFDLHIPLDFEWPVWVKDRPVAGTEIKKYRPVCTVHAESDSWMDLNKEIELRKNQIETMLAQMNEKVLPVK